MSFLSDLIDRGRDLIGLPEREPAETEAIEVDRFDRTDWGKLREEVPYLNQEIERLSVDNDYVEDLFQDFFAAAYKADPKMRDFDQMKPTHVGNRAMIEQIQDMPEFQEVRQYSRGDEYASVMAMMSMQDTLRTALTRTKELKAEAEEEERRREEERQHWEQVAQDIQELIEQLGTQPETDPNGTPSGGQQQVQQLIEWWNGPQGPGGGNGPLVEKAEQIAQGTAKQIRDALKQAAEERREEDALCTAFGYEDGELQRMSIEERMELAKALKSSRLAKFTKILGQFKMVQQAESRKRVVNASTEVHGVKFSDELERLTAGEYLNFADPDLELLFWLRYTEQQLLTYDVRGVEKLGQGPLIYIMDESGSMSCTDVMGGTREAWGKALGLAMLDQARKRNRDFVYIGFSSSRQQHVIHFPKHEPVHKQVHEMAEHFFSGGTEYETPLKMALDIAEKEFDLTTNGKPDIVFVTDDAYGAMNEDFMHEYNRVKDKTQMKTYGIAVGCDFSGALQQVSDNVRSITDMVESDPRALGDLFRTL